MEEEWRPIAGFEGWYSISNLGRVRRDRGAANGTTFVGRILRGSLTREGYIRVRLSRGSRHRKRFLIHRLALLAFVGPEPPGMESNHKDGDKAANQSKNLEWVTRPENQTHAVAHGLVKPQPGRGQIFRKLSDEQIMDVRFFARIGLPHRWIAAHFCVSRSFICNVTKHRRRA